jgi:transcriptional regulator with XRE-family HTH domain
MGRMSKPPSGKGLPTAVAKSRPRTTPGTADAPSALNSIRTAMIEKKLTQSALADAADCHEKTIQNLLAGKPVRDQTLFDVAMVLGLDYDQLRVALSPNGTAVPPAVPATEPHPPRLAATPAEAGHGGGIAPIYMGAYTRAATDHLIGAYLTLRPAFSQPDTYVAFRTDILWDETWPSLLFEERERPDATYAHRGRLYIPASSPFMHLVSLTKGAMRMILVSQIDREGVLRGIITTLNKHKAQLVPVATPIVYLKQEAFAGDAFGEIGPAHRLHATYRSHVAATMAEGYARLVPGN